MEQLTRNSLLGRERREAHEGCSLEAQGITKNLNFPRTGTGLIGMGRGGGWKLVSKRSFIPSETSKCRTGGPVMSPGHPKADVASFCLGGGLKVLRWSRDGVAAALEQRPETRGRSDCGLGRLGRLDRIHSTRWLLMPTTPVKIHTRAHVLSKQNSSGNNSELNSLIYFDTCPS